MKRIQSLDLAKGFTVLFIAPIHVMLLLSKPSLQESIVGYIFRFIAEGPGAQLLMLLMGISFYLSPKKSFNTIFERCMGLMIAGYFLNVWKFVIPTCFNIMPKDFLQYLNYSPTEHGLVKLALIGDILQFAALTQFILYLLSKVTKHHILYFTLAAFVCFVAPVCWDLTAGDQLTNYFLQLMGGQPPFVFFPLFPWLVYPLIGMGIGYFIKEGSPVSSLLFLGIVFIIVGQLISNYIFPCDEDSFYRTCPGDTIFHLGIVLSWIAGWDVVSSRVADNIFFRMLVFLSKNITLVYFIQWILIGWLVPIVGFQVLGAKLSFIAILLVEVNVLGFAFIITEIRKKPA